MVLEAQHVLREIAANCIATLRGDKVVFTVVIKD